MLTDAIVFLNQKGLKLGLPGFGGDVKDAEKERIAMVQKGEEIRTASTTGDTSGLDATLITHPKETC